MQRDSLDFDVVIVGAGPAGLAAACRLGQLAKSQRRELDICAVEKAAEVGGHIVSGAVVESRALDELFPDWRERGAPLRTPVERVSYGARAVNKGGLQSLPRLSFPGGLLVGCEAGFLNGAKIKGTPTAMKTGMLAAETVFESLQGDEQSSPRDLTAFQERVEGSWVWEELHRARNFSPGLHRFGTMLGAALAFLEHNVLLGRTPFTLHNRKSDHECLVEADKAPRIDYPRPDGAISFDKLSSVFVSNTNHEEDQPCHLKLDDSRIPVEHNLPKFDEPAQRYCPAAVYEIVVEESSLSIGQM